MPAGLSLQRAKMALVALIGFGCFLGVPGSILFGVQTSDTSYLPLPPVRIYFCSIDDKVKNTLARTGVSFSPPPSR
jgi:hypothetical protein